VIVIGFGCEANTFLADFLISWLVAMRGSGWGGGVEMGVGGVALVKVWI